MIVPVGGTGIVACPRAKTSARAPARPGGNDPGPAAPFPPGLSGRLSSAPGRSPYRFRAGSRAITRPASIRTSSFS
jgi:hypothetical protein